MVEPLSSASIDFTEAAYDLEVASDDWLPRLLTVGGGAIDHGLGVVALTCFRPPEPGPLVIDQIRIADGPDDFGERLLELQSQVPPGLLWPLSRPGMPKTLSEVTDDHHPEAFKQIMGHFAFARDGLGISAFEPSGHGVFLIAPLAKVTTLSAKARDHWQMLAAHFDAGYRLQRALRAASRPSDTGGELPHGAEAVIDPSNFRVTEAAGAAKSGQAINALRDAAKTVDHARGSLRQRDPDTALELWKALVRGRWSTVDWFDTDGRRYILGIPNAPDVTDPRGLTEREMQVVSYAVAGMSNKLIAYHLGISKGRVSTLLSSAKHKLRVGTRAELVQKVRGFVEPPPK